VTWVDITELGRNPGRILGLAGAFVDKHSHRRVRMLGEPVWPGRTAVEYPACLQFEALVNLAFDDLDVTCACLYDAARLDDNVLADAHVTHPIVEQGGSRRRSAEYSPDAALLRGNEPLLTRPVALTFTVSAPDDLSRARQHSTRYGPLLGLPPDRIADLQLVVTELATNSLQHGGGTSRLAFWEHDGHLVCEARDSGYLADPLVGRRPPARDRPSPSGLFVVNALADLVRTYTSPDGTTIQVYLRLERPVGEVA
jgi:anti-sigma regulatory factor (Ser/Thr protein kinase)